MRSRTHDARLLTLALAAAIAGGCGRRPSAAAAASVAPAAATAAVARATVPALPEADRVRIAEAFRIAGQLGDSVWAGWREVPFAVLLVTPSHEFLLRHPRPTPDFALVGRDSLLGDVYARPRVFLPTLEATFPAVGGVSTVVMGDAERTRKGSSAWVLTLLHEHFHQLQTTRPGYYAAVNALGLARGDTTGMWMLNYAFPYDSAVVQERFSALAAAAASAIEAPPANPADGAARLAAVAAARDRLRAALPADDYRYLAFQLWQEGVARYTEYALARLAARRYEPTPAFRALPDYRPFADEARRVRDGIVAGARPSTLGTAKRVALYPAGAALALLLDDGAPGWRSRYFAHPFSLDAHLPPAPAPSAAGGTAPGRARTAGGASRALAWMAGCWERRTGDRLLLVEEQWLAPRGGTLLGVGRTTRGDSLVEYEFMRVYEGAGDTLVFAAHPSGQPSAEFRAPPPHGDGRAVTFENAAHDFPQRVIYRRAGPDSLVARVEGTRGGRVRGVSFPYRRARCR